MVSAVTFAQHADRFIERLAKRQQKPVKKTSIATFRAAIGMATPVLGELPLEVIDNENMRQLVERLSERYAPNTVRLVLRTTKKVIASATDERGNKLVSKEWNNDHINPPPAANRTSAQLLTAERIETALDAAPPIIREFISTQAATGLRKGELLALNVEDFNPATRILRVERTRSHFDETSPKTAAGKREVDLHPKIAVLLQGMLAGRTTGRLFEASIDEVRRAFERLGLKIPWSATLPVYASAKCGGSDAHP